MPFSSALIPAISGARNFTLAALTAEDLAALYDVEGQFAAQFPTQAPSRAGDIIKLTVGGFNFVAALTTQYCIDADGLDDEVSFELTLTAGCFIHGLGGNGGRGGHGISEPPFPGDDVSTNGLTGTNGGTAIRLGCPTFIFGIGTITNGFAGGGGGGGGASSSSSEHGGGGGGGGVPLGIGGQGGSGGAAPGTAGGQGSLIARGARGLRGGNSAGDGGFGGENGTPAGNGLTGTGAGVGGPAGVPGDAMHTQGFAYTPDPGIVIIGNVT